MRRILVSLMLAMTMLSSLSALEIKDGKIKLTIDDRNGRFSVFYLSDVVKNIYIPLLYDQESRTTYPTLFLDQKTYKLGEASEFRTTIIPSGTAVLIEYRSSFCIVHQKISFIKSDGSSLADGIDIEFTVENISEKDLSVGVRYLFDTWMGERLGTHFETGSGVPILTETEIKGDSDEGSILTPGEKGVSLLVQLGGKTTKPNKTIIANWKRINDAPWAFDVVASRNFTLLPYSINDSAVALYYEPEVIRRGSFRVINIAIGEASGGGFGTAAVEPSAVEGTSSTESAFNSVVNASSATTVDIMTDLIAARDLVASINDLIASGKAPTEAQLKVFREILERLEQRKRNY